MKNLSSLLYGNSIYYQGVFRPLLFILLTTPIRNLYPQENSEWKEVRKQDGIVVFESDSSIKRIKKYRAEMIVNSTVWEGVNLIKNPDRYQEWISGIDSAHLILKENDSVFYYHSYTSIPILRNIDVAARVKVFQNQKQQKVYTRSEVIPDLEVHEKYRRLKVFRNSWKFESISDRKTKISYSGIIDVYNSFVYFTIKNIIINDIYDTMKNMRNTLQGKNEK